MPTKLIAQPEPIEIDLHRTALIIVDMQNTFICKGGVFDLAGVDVSENEKIVEPIKKLSTAARANDIKVVYIAHILSRDLREAGPDSSFGYRLRQRDPAWLEKYHIRGTWGAEIIDALKPQPGDMFVEKPRFSAFYGTNLDVILRGYSLKYLLFVGCATNICVEASLRDAGHLDYFPILVSDATAHLGPPFTQEATIFNVQRCYGWVTTTPDLLKVLA